MKKRFSVEQITAVLQQAAQGVPVGNLCRKVGISEQSFYRWKKVYGSLQPSEARELKQLRDEVTKLKRLVADLSLDKVMLQDVIQKSSETRQAARGREILDGTLHGQRAPRVRRHPRDAVHRVLQELQRPVDGVTRTDARARADPRPLRLPSSPHPVTPGRLGGREMLPLANHSFWR